MYWQPDTRQLAWLKVALFLVCLLPFGIVLWAAQAGDLGPDPEKFVEDWTGIWTFNFLLLSLCVTPLRTISRLHWLMRLRRMLGLFVFFYALLHLLSFIGFNHEFSIDNIARDIVDRPFIAVGFTAFVLLIPLAATSNQWAIGRLGGRRWQELHRSIYLIGILGAVHYLWLAQGVALLWPIAYALALGALLVWRIRERQRRAIPAPTIQTTQTLRYFKRRPE